MPAGVPTALGVGAAAGGVAAGMAVRRSKSRRHPVVRTAMKMTRRKPSGPLRGYSLRRA